MWPGPRLESHEYDQTVQKTLSAKTREQTLTSVCFSFKSSPQCHPKIASKQLPMPERPEPSWFRKPRPAERRSHNHRDENPVKRVATRPAGVPNRSPVPETHPTGVWERGRRRVDDTSDGPWRFHRPRGRFSGSTPFLGWKSLPAFRNPWLEHDHRRLAPNMSI